VALGINANAYVQEVAVLFVLKRVVAVVLAEAELNTVLSLAT
jgi:hypothetical protein